MTELLHPRKMILPSNWKGSALIGRVKRKKNFNGENWTKIRKKYWRRNVRNMNLKSNKFEAHWLDGRKFNFNCALAQNINSHSVAKSMELRITVSPESKWE
jgi:hypothetical protein